MRRRSYHQQNTQWLVPGLTVAGLTAFFVWQFDVIPVDIGAPETGTLQTDDEFRTDETFEPEPFVAQDADRDLPLGDEPGMSVDPDSISDEIVFAPEPQPFEVPEQGEPDVMDSDLPPQFNEPPPAFDDPPVAVAERESNPAPVRQQSPPSPNQQHRTAFDDFPAEMKGAAGEGGIQQSAPRTASRASGVIQQASATADSTPRFAKTASLQTPAIQRKLSEIDALLEEDDYLTAHAELSRIYWNQPELREVISDRIEHTAGSIYAAPQPHYVRPYVVQPNDQLSRIAERYSVPWQYLARLNRVSERRIRPGQKLKVIKGPFEAVVDLSDFELTLHAHGYYVHRYPVGIGTDGTTPLGKFTIREKLTNPTWYNPDGGVIGPDDPDNPLGEHWIGLGDGYGIHGTIEPDSIGKAESRGCIRMANDDIAEVFDLLTSGSTIIIRR